MEFIKSGDAYDLGGSAVVVNVDAEEVHDPERWHDYAPPGAARGIVALAVAYAEDCRAHERREAEDRARRRIMPNLEDEPGEWPDWRKGPPDWNL